MADVSKVVDLATYRLRRQKPAVDQLVETIAIYDEVLARLDRLQKRAPVREARS
jgi:hypothetical protein